jgi:cell division protein FtsW
VDLLKNIFKGDKVIWIIFLALCLISVIEVFSAASTLTYKSGDHWAPITQHAVLLMVGAVIVVITHNIRYKWFQVIPVALYPISIALLGFVLFMGLVSGDRVNGASRWMSFMGLQFQPSELAKMAVIIAVSSILSRKQDEDGANPKAFKHIMILTGIVLALIAPENLSTAGLLFGVVCVMMFIGRVQARKLFTMFGALLFLFLTGCFALKLIPEDSNIGVLHRAKTWEHRLTNFANKEEIPAAKFDIDKDAQKAHARIAVATSHVIGKGPGNSIQRDFLSQAFSDFIFAIIIEELGLVGGAGVVILYILLLVRAGKIAQKCDRTFPAFLVMGIAIMLVSQALLNMMVAVGLFPITGQPLPLISKGGTSTFINCAYIGMILSVSRYTAELEERKAAENQQKLIPVFNSEEEMNDEDNNGDANSEAQIAEDPKSEILNSDAVFEDDK